MGYFSGFGEGMSRLWKATKNTANKLWNGVDKATEGKTLMRFGNEAEARWVTPFKPVTKEVAAEINGISESAAVKIGNATANIVDDEATVALEKQLFAKEKIRAANAAVDRESTNLSARLNIGNAEEYEALTGTGISSTKASAQGLKAAIQDETSMASERMMLEAEQENVRRAAFTSEDRALKRHDPSYRERLSDAGTSAQGEGLTQNQKIAEAANVEGNVATELSAVHNAANSTQVANAVENNTNMATAGANEAAEASRQSIRTTDNIPVDITSKGSRDMTRAVSALGLGATVNAIIGKDHGRQANWVLYHGAQKTLGSMYGINNF